MKPRDKERLAKNRGMIIRALDVETIMDFMRRENGLSKNDEDKIMQDPRRRQRAAILLDMLESKKTASYDVFLEALEEYYPHLYLQLIDWEDDGPGMNDAAYGAGGDDEWSALRRTRKFLIREMDCTRVLPYMKKHEVISDDEVNHIVKSKNTEERTEVFLDLLETKPASAYDIFLDAVGEMYPHIYLMLTDHDDDDLNDL